MEIIKLMKVLKFGGTSLSNAKKFIEVSNIIKKKIKYEDVGIVLSAPAKVTNYLELIINNIRYNKETKSIFEKLNNIFYKLVIDIHNIESNFPKITLLQHIHDTFQNIQYQTKKSDLENKNNIISAKIISTGEMLSIKLMTTIFVVNKYPIFIIDPIKHILSIGNPANSYVDLSKSKKNIQELQIPKKHIIFMPGFIAGNEQKEIVTLGRNGSDYSAAILSVCLDADTCEIWTDVDGIYTADPKIVPNAHLLKSLSYEEAIKLSHFGAKVLHPKTILPLYKNNIKCIIKNTYFPEHLGTIIQNNNRNNKPQNVIGITFLNNVSSITIEFNNNVNIIKYIKKTFSILKKNEIEIISFINSPLENKTIFYTINKKTIQTKHTIEKILYQELEEKNLKNIIVIKQLSIIYIIQNNQIKNINVDKNILSVLKNTDLNVIKIHSQFSKNTLAIITDNTNLQTNIKIIHDRLFNKKNILEIFIIGVGGVGKALIKQFIMQKNRLKEKNIKFKVCSISNTKNTIINIDGLKLNNWEEQLNIYNNKFNIEKIIKTANQYGLYNPVIVDCTASKKIANYYYHILKNNIHIVTPNKKANSGSWEEYQKLKNISIQTNKKFLYETNVSAGLPIIRTLKNLFDSGDQLINFTGILSGSLSFIFGKLEEGMSISAATIMAKEMGFTEPNPKDDLSGIDVARKLLILAREAGYPIELKDIKITPILPQELLNIENEKEFLTELAKLDNYFFKKIKTTLQKNKVLRVIGTINKKGFCQVKLAEINIQDPLYNVKNGENALTIYSKYYQPIPLVLRGYGAGNNVTAAGIFSDLLQILS